MKLERNSLVANIWILSILLYLFRTIAEPLKYPFVISFGILLLSYSYFLLINFRKNVALKYLRATKEFQILGLFLVSGIILSTAIEILSVKSLINFLGIAVFFLVYYEYRNHINLKQVLRGWIFLAMLIGILGLLKWLSYISESGIEWFSSFYKYGSSLVSDYNVYAYYFIISLVIYFYGLHREIIRTKLVANQAVLLLFLINVALTGSRRGLILLVLFILAGIILLLRKRKEKHLILYKNLACLNAIILAFFIIIIALVPFRSQIVHNTATKVKIVKSVYRYSTIVKPGITYSILFDKLWPKVGRYENDNTDWEAYATYNNIVDGEIKDKYRDYKSEYWLNMEKEHLDDNLFYNGDFKYGSKFWVIGAPDSIKHEIISTKYGYALRVSRIEGNGYWPLKYEGRKILYYKDVTYTFKFKYRVKKGSGVPFKIGWWVNEGEGHKNNLPHKTRPLGNGWFEYTASYRFRDNQANISTFMNSQQTNTVVDFADIELTCDDTLERPKYLDLSTQLSGANLFYNSNFEKGLEFWGSDTPDTITHVLIDTQYGKAIRVSRKDGKGYWPLVYQGREIFYHKNITYYLRYKVRVIKGGETPYRIGWWAKDDETIPYNLHLDIYPLNNEWYECMASYKFKNNHYGYVKAFMNSQEANTIIDFTDIELLCNDTLNLPIYADEKTDYIDTFEKQRLDQELGTIKETVLSKRITRWKYALELWRSEYHWSKKLFGGGFDYLEKFGKKFYPEEDRIDYPHNPIISSFLYSGIIGGVFYIYFLVLSFWYYWKYRKHHLLFFILFVITFMFVFISSDSHFNVPVFAMLSLVPFLSRSALKEKIS